jgi:hypothetical protein
VARMPNRKTTPVAELSAQHTADELAGGLDFRDRQGAVILLSYPARHRLGVPDMVIQRILRHANVSTTATYYINTPADDVRSAMAKLERNIPSANQTPKVLRDTFGDTKARLHRSTIHVAVSFK